MEQYLTNLGKLFVQAVMFSLPAEELNQLGGIFSLAALDIGWLRRAARGFVGGPDPGVLLSSAESRWERHRREIERRIVRGRGLNPAEVLAAYFRGYGIHSLQSPNQAQEYSVEGPLYSPEGVSSFDEYPAWQREFRERGALSRPLTDLDTLAGQGGLAATLHFLATAEDVHHGTPEEWSRSIAVGELADNAMNLADAATSHRQAGHEQEPRESTGHASGHPEMIWGAPVERPSHPDNVRSVTPRERANQTSDRHTAAAERVPEHLNQPRSGSAPHQGEVPEAAAIRSERLGAQNIVENVHHTSGGGPAPNRPAELHPRSTGGHEVTGAGAPGQRGTAAAVVERAPTHRQPNPSRRVMPRPQTAPDTTQPSEPPASRGRRQRPELYDRRGRSLIRDFDRKRFLSELQRRRARGYPPNYFLDLRNRYREWALDKISATPGHLLEFLLDHRSGRFRRSRSRRHSALVDSVSVDMGHVISRSMEPRERVALQDAFINQSDGLTTERADLGGGVENVVIEIGGVAVEYRSAVLWERYGFLPSGTVARARRSRGWTGRN